MTVLHPGGLFFSLLNKPIVFSPEYNLKFESFKHKIYFRPKRKSLKLIENKKLKNRWKKGKQGRFNAEDETERAIDWNYQ